MSKNCYLCDPQAYVTDMCEFHSNIFKEGVDWFKNVRTIGPGSLTCDRVFGSWESLECPKGCHGTGGCKCGEK